MSDTPLHSDLVSRGRVRDARGTVVTLLDPARLRLRPRQDVIPEAQLDTILEEIEPGLARRSRQALVATALLLLGLVGGVVAMWLVAGPARRGSVTGVFSNPAMWLPMVVSVITPWIALQARDRRAVHEALLRHRRCAHCGYDLAAAGHAEADGALRCPECGCTWRCDLAPAAAAGSLACRSGRARPAMALLAAGVALLLAGIAVFLLR